MKILPPYNFECTIACSNAYFKNFMIVKLK